jgi:hypothetical protein
MFINYDAYNMLDENAFKSNPLLNNNTSNQNTSEDTKEKDSDDRTMIKALNLLKLYNVATEKRAGGMFRAFVGCLCTVIMTDGSSSSSGSDSEDAVASPGTPNVGRGQVKTDRSDKSARGTAELSIVGVGNNGSNNGAPGRLPNIFGDGDSRGNSKSLIPPPLIHHHPHQQQQPPPHHNPHIVNKKYKMNKRRTKSLPDATNHYKAALAGNGNNNGNNHKRLNINGASVWKKQ